MPTSISNGEKREIKFRAWDIKDGMLYPTFEWKRITYYSSHSCGAEMSVVFSQNSYDGNGKYHEDPSPELDKLIWMQFTGLKDKNGKEIYEGDILSGEHGIYSSDDPSSGNLRLVKWDDEEPRLTNAYIDGNTRTSGFTFCKKNTEAYFEVIGNIYEHPELLEPSGGRA